MNRRQLEYFGAVAEHGGFTSAARALYVSQPSLSQAIKSFEDELGVALFNRFASGVRLTSAGEALLGPARRTLRDFDRAIASVKGVCALDGGSVAIAALPILAADPLARFIGRFRAIYPGVVVRIADPGHGDVLELLRSGDCEIGVTIEPIRAKEADTFTLGVEPLYVVLPPDQLVASGEPFPAKELERLPLVAVSSTKALLSRILARNGVRASIAVETAHRDSVLPLILAGAGAGVMPLASAMQAAALGATACPIEPRITRTVVFAYRHHDLSPAARAFTDLVRETALEPVELGSAKDALADDAILTA